MADLFTELKRRNVFRVAVMYVIVGWLIAQVAELAADSFGAPDWVMKMFLTFLVLGFPVAFVFAWAFEMTPEGIKREKDVDRSQSITPRTGRRIDFIIIAVLVMAVVFLGWRQFGQSGSGGDLQVAQSSGLPSVAVLPFVNMSDDAANEYFSDGISEELLNLLVKIEGLRVPSRTSSFAFKGTNTEIGEIAEKLDVDHILEGSVRKAGDRVRITAQLIDVADDSHVWSETYDRNLDDIFAVQDEIATEIVNQLRVTLGAGGEVHSDAPTDNMEAYQLYLQARHLFHGRDREEMKRAIGYLDEATTLDPDFGQAYTALASVNMVLAGAAGESYEDFTDASLQALDSALRLNPESAEAHAVKGLIAGEQHRWAEGEENLKRAVELEPNAVYAQLWYGIFLTTIGRTADSVPYLEKAVELDPVSGLALGWLAGLRSYTDDPDGALELTQLAIDLGGGATWRGVWTLLRIDRVEEAREALHGASAEQDLDNSWVDPFIDAVVNPDLTPAALAALERVEASEPRFESLVWLPELGESDAFIQEFRAEIDRGELGRAHIHMTWLWDPRYPGLRATAGFREFVDEVGLVDYWNEYGWPDLCRPVGGDIECD